MYISDERSGVMVVLIPYPDGKTFNSFRETSRSEIYDLRNQILEYVRRVCTGPWNSDELDMLHNGIRVRIGSEKDYFALKLKYGDI